jgi:uncharacterized hydrophobic protein (TIGR00271 family)
MNKKPNNVPDYARVVVVPVANPKNAPRMLQIASAMTAPDSGKVIALLVTLGDAEREAKSLEELQPVIDVLVEAGHPVTLRTEHATSIARGILDAVREEGADLLVLGVKHPVRGQVVLGPIAENVATTALCDVLIYRAAQKEEVNRVVAWANGSEAARVACHVGMLLGEAQSTPVEGIYVLSNNRSYWNSLGRIDQSLADLPKNFRVKRTVVTARDLASGLIARLNEDDLLVVGFSRRSELERWLYGDFARELLNHAPGSVILTTRRGVQHGIGTRMQQGINWASPTLTKAEREEIIRQGQENADPNLDYIVLILISAVIASLGLLLNSATVIIGAMLIAPLMQPLSAFSTGMSVGRIDLLRRSIISVMIGFALAICVGFFTGWIIPFNIPTGEMLSRGSPSLIDAGVALASGMVGAYATARKGIPAALAGVAIAAALMPPVCTIGLGIAFQEYELALGATLLFLTNIACMVLAGWAVLFWMGMRPERDAALLRNRLISLAVVLGLLIPIFIALISLTNRANRIHDIENALERSFDPAEVIEVEVNSDEEPLQVIATIRTSEAPRADILRDAESALVEVLRESVELKVIVLRYLEP